MGMDLAEKIDDLLTEARSIEESVSRIQGEDTTGVSNTEIRDIRDQYQSWYAACLPLLPDDIKEKFQKEYEGRTLVWKIRAFLADPTKPNVLVADLASEQRRPIFLSHWQYPYATAFLAPFAEQQALLRQALARPSPAMRMDKGAVVGSDLRHSIALACKDHYIINSIDGLFISNGSHEDWWTAPKKEYSSSRMRQVFGWFEGIVNNAPDQGAVIARGVGETITADLTVSKVHREAIKVALEGMDGVTREGHPLDRYNLHPRVREVAGKLFRDGHYRQAVLDAYIALTNAVKERSERPDLDTSKLMLQVFSKEKTILRCSPDSDEQMGFMWLFAGAVMAIRNPRAHHLGDSRAVNVDEVLEWLALASALFRVLDSAQKV